MVKVVLAAGGVFIYTLFIICIVSLACASSRSTAIEESYNEGYKEGYLVGLKENNKEDKQ